jgi:hypothetical protein
VHGVAARQHPVHERAESVEIRALVEQRLGLEALGRHERWRAHDQALQTKGRERAEIDQLGLALGGEAHVGWRQIAVDQPARVYERQRGGHVTKDGAGFPHRLGLLTRQILARQELHRVVRALTIDAVVVDLDDAGMRQIDQVPILVLEQGAQARPRTLVLDVQALEGDLAREQAIVDAVNGAHPAARELHAHVVAARDHELVTWTRSPCLFHSYADLTVLPDRLLCAR